MRGAVGAWSFRDGSRLALAHLHGPIGHLVLRDAQLYVASELGAMLSWDLRDFRSEYCALLEHVWKSVPTEWREGRPVATSVPDGHVCR